MGPQKQLRVVKIVKIVNRVAGAELDALNLLKVHIKHLLNPGCDSAEAHAVEGLGQRLPELPVKQRWQGRIVHRVIPFLRGVVHHLAAVHQHHKLVGVHVDHRAVGHGIAAPLHVGAAPLSHLHAPHKHGLVAHVIGFHHLQPLIAKGSPNRRLY